MDIRVLKYFLMVAREENITKAANLLHLTQPTLSRQLMQLEEELGGTTVSSQQTPHHPDRRWYVTASKSRRNCCIGR